MRRFINPINHRSLRTQRYIRSRYRGIKHSHCSSVRLKLIKNKWNNKVIQVLKFAQKNLLNKNAV